MTDERHEHDDDALSAELRNMNPPPPTPVDSIWRGVEAGLAGALERERAERAARRRIRVPLVGAIAASLALFGSGAAIGYGLNARDDGAVVDVDVDERTPTDQSTYGVAGDTVRVAWF